MDMDLAKVSFGLPIYETCYRMLMIEGAMLDVKRQRP